MKQDLLLEIKNTKNFTLTHPTHKSASSCTSMKYSQESIAPYKNYLTNSTISKNTTGVMIFNYTRLHHWYSKNLASFTIILSSSDQRSDLLWILHSRYVRSMREVSRLTESRGIWYNDHPIYKATMRSTSPYKTL